MAKKSKRPPARKQQRHAARPGLQPHAHPAAPPAAELPVDADQEHYAAGALPVTEGDGPMPLPPPEPHAAEDAPVPVVATSIASAGERRRVGRIDPAAQQQRTAGGQRAKSGRTLSTAAMFEPLPPEEAAIPFDRVPYVPADLRRVLVIGGLMVVLVVVADFVVNAVVK
jgi:hypothetical protein